MVEFVKSAWKVYVLFQYLIWNSFKQTNTKWIIVSVWLTTNRYTFMNKNIIITPLKFPLSSIVFLITYRVKTSGLGQVKDVKLFCYLKTNTFVSLERWCTIMFLISCSVACFVKPKNPNKTGIVTTSNYFLISIFPCLYLLIFTKTFADMFFLICYVHVN